MFDLVSVFLKGWQRFSPFESYYAAIIRDGAAGVPTAEEARRDQAHQQARFTNLGSL